MQEHCKEEEDQREHPVNKAGAPIEASRCLDLHAFIPCTMSWRWSSSRIS